MPMPSEPLLTRLLRDGGIEVRQSVENALNDCLSAAKVRGMDNAPCPVCGSVATESEGPDYPREGDNRFTQPYWCNDCESQWKYIFQVTGIADVQLADGTPVLQ